MGWITKNHGHLLRDLGGKTCLNPVLSGGKFDTENKLLNGGDRSTRLTSVILVATFVSFILPYIASSVNIALPVIGREFGAGAVLLGWIPTTYILTSAVLLIPIGRLADMYGLKRIFLSGVAVFTAGVFVCGFSVSVPMLIACQIVEGIGAAMVYSTVVAILSVISPPGDRGRVIGLNVAAGYVGLSAGPFIGGILIHLFGWRSIYFTIVPVGLLAVFMIVRTIRGEWIDGPEERFDTKGAVVYGLMLSAMVYGLSTLTTGGLLFVCLGAVLLAAFVIIEFREQYPVFNIRIFKGNRTFGFSGIAALISYCATFAIAFLLSLYLQCNRGLDPVTAGTILVAQPVAIALLSPVAGRWVDRTEPAYLASAGMGVTAVCLFVFTYLTEETPLYSVVLLLVLLGVGFAFFSAPNIYAIMSSVDRSCYGVASATMGTMRLVGQMLSMGLSMMVFSVYIGPSEITEAVHTGLLESIHLIFLICSILCFAGIFFSLKRGKIRGI